MATPPPGFLDRLFGKAPTHPDFVQMVEDLERAEPTPRTRLIRRMQTYPMLAARDYWLSPRPTALPVSPPATDPLRRSRLPWPNTLRK